MPAVNGSQTSPSARPSKKARHSNGTAKPSTKPSSALENALLQNKGKKLTATSTTMNGFRKERNARTDESRAVVGTKFSEGFGNVKNDVEMKDAPEVVEISSASSSDGSEDGAEDDEAEPAQEKLLGVQKKSVNPTEAPNVNGFGAHKREREEDEGDLDADDGTTSTLRDPDVPSFADLLKARSPTLIPVHSPSPPPFTSLSHPGPQPTASALAPLDNPTPPHLTALLTTALRTSDPTLLNTCLLTPSLTTIRLTIERLSSPLTIPLLSHLANTMHRRPGRAGSLMVWVQWILVSHGGYLASLLAAAATDGKGPRGKKHVGAQAQEVVELMKKLRALERVCDERARGLERLLALKGKLDLLVAQMEVRKGRKEERRRRREDERVWVEGQGDEGWDSSDDRGIQAIVGAEGEEDLIDVEAAVRADLVAAGMDAAESRVPKPSKGSARRKANDDILAKSRRRYERLGMDDGLGSAGSSDDDEMPTTGMLNGVGTDEEEEEEEEDEESEDDDASLLDDEAEETSDDDGSDGDDDDVFDEGESIVDDGMDVDELESEVEMPKIQLKKSGKGKGKGSR
ncbi:NUC189-domain-containing protein [Eremomyces bilateralis CBS 781.70]|uniref:NUC189-domain-containing protein n=1 Tax=Eremomyces bilateralis CBS 781.70 TaxID=1392243 RepID=A0A6G1FZY3_9PEZI|nr:NUC189-domain-containing protein [Eremomyces bilateralis CBS 781.70]KAF1811230.1 NUC189-domain-containing protein [Eremomyces bilateralis CBS 781.70]